MTIFVIHHRITYDENHLTRNFKSPTREVRDPLSTTPTTQIKRYDMILRTLVHLHGLITAQKTTTNASAGYYLLLMWAVISWYY